MKPSALPEAPPQVFAAGTPAGSDAPEARLDLVVSGMTCAACALRIEKKLNRLPGVTAEVNYATEHARAEVDDSVSDADLIATVEATGYSAYGERTTEASCAS